MNLLYLAYRNMVSKPLNMVLSLVLLVLSVSLVTFVLQLGKQLNGQMDKNITPVDMVVGAKGSPLQLVLSSVLHIDVPTGNIKLEEAESIKNHPFVGSAISVSYGDNYKGYRILGTEPGYLDNYGVVLSEGGLFQRPFEIVAGNTVAKKLGLQIGDRITSSHGLAAAGGEAHDDHPYTIAGILEPSGTVVDQLLVCDLESIWDAHSHHGEEQHNEDEKHEEGEHDHEGHDHEEPDHEEHDHEGHDHDHEGHDHKEHEGGEQVHDEANDTGHDYEDHDDELEITSLLVKFKSPLGLVQLPRFINENTNMQAALPGFEIQRLMGFLGSGVKTINGIAFAILFVSGFSIFISLLKTIRERRQELALLRTYGLGTRKLLFLVLFEGLLLALIGFWLGWVLGRLALALASGYIESGYGYVLQLNGPNLPELLLFGVTLVIAIIAVLLASTSIFKLNISKTLADV
ncbi:ABC transporter permease [Muricauda sp. SCSIO 64092]|uniref:ABC transporter permease n=1 Tax=Allomuricauda sp. SCSIO 64092 TaxID=2908842 RepID=UPI001FF44B72|nr:FtsX-like permease family protein [Muricauda sp. SCSIO 64092]UOY06330.1 ABC transporter permease [Muricauda sp. SCSIO 64092]